MVSQVDQELREGRALGSEENPTPANWEETPMKDRSHGTPRNQSQEPQANRAPTTEDDTPVIQEAPVTEDIHPQQTPEERNQEPQENQSHAIEENSNQDPQENPNPANPETEADRSQGIPENRPERTEVDRNQDLADLQEAQQAIPDANIPQNDHMNDPANIDGPIAVDNFSDDESSEFGDDSDITSLSSSVLEYEFENGRRYHSNRVVSLSCFRGRRMPNDEEEQDRMDLTHHIWLLLLKGELHKAPVTNPQKILDLGTGTGIWALDIAEKFPSAKVIGNDISAIQPDWVVPNVEFIIEDFESEWLYQPNSFDFIHARLLAGCVTNWPAFFRKIFAHIKPGCYFEIQESGFWAWSDDGTVTHESPINQYLSALIEAGRAIGRELNIYYKLKDWMVEAGFEDVQQFTYLLPYSPWPRDPHLKELGKYQALMVQQAVESYGLRLCTQVLGWGVEPSRIFQAMAKKNLRDKNAHAYVKEVVVYGRKPLNSW
ncbi:hypothetical protein N7457_001398 [Penicillium paradoxum]|uniref:uncharacterized protein n=1 Tax=Penicillium paradoxum TaxID=176176 RepID=UPI0025494E93|nr:uncharacterized protein N7457_001398 [Penicillium paradoxum]KAJ5794799.1 hypothetical protein N7457_001398 [Penicillium paradoxum]